MPFSSSVSRIESPRRASISAPPSAKVSSPKKVIWSSKLPAAQTCRMCHQVPQGKSPEAARLTVMLTSGVPLRFKKLFHLPPSASFSHRRPAGIAQLPCADCHGQIDLTTVPPTRPLVTIRMQVCLDCHQATGQSLDCVACHR